MSAPLIVRVAGLPGEVMGPFSDRALLDTLAEGDRLRERLARTRSALVDCLHGAIRTPDREERRFLLSVKRSCFNGGALKAFRQDPQWPLLLHVASALVEELVALEEAAEEAGARLEELYRRALRREREKVVTLLDDQAFVRGVAIASPEVARNLDRLRGREPESFGRREKRLCLTLSRYASRAALKLSPLSTLTRTALVLVTDDTAGDLSLLPVSAWRERSTASLRYELLAQCSCLLQRCCAFTEGLPVALNETVAFDGEGCCSFLRPSHWEYEDESRSFLYRDASAVRARLEGSLIPWLVDELRAGPVVYGLLRERARAALQDEDPDLADQILDELIGIGFLNLLLPWDFSEPGLEEQILRHLETLADVGELDGFRRELRGLAELLAGYAETASPAGLLEASRQGVEGLFRSLVPAAGLDPRSEFRAGDNTFEEEVFLRPEPGGSPGIARLSAERARELVRDLAPFARLIGLQSSLPDLRVSLAAFAERRWPGRTEVGFLELFRAAQPLFDQYLRHRAGGQSASPATSFNPLGLEAVADLASRRQRIQAGLRDCFQAGDQGQRLCLRALDALLDRAGGGHAQSPAFCAFVQPLDPEGRQWILNTVGDGLGHFSGRFTTGMDDGTRRFWTDYFTARSLLEIAGEPVELIDVTFPESRTINVHAPQTRRVLRLPGERSGLPAERLLRLSDLRVRLGGAEPVLTDPAGRRLLPVQLGSLAAGGTPTLLKFLGTFGRGERHWRLPIRPGRKADGVEVMDRHTAGSVVYSRKKWIVAPRELLSSLTGETETTAFARIDRWRQARGIPERVFVREPIRIDGELFRLKPQYISFSSPSFVQIFRSILSVDVDALVLEEALPIPEQFPLSGGRWAVEVQLESFAIQSDTVPLALCERSQRQPAWQA